MIMKKLVLLGVLFLSVFCISCSDDNDHSDPNRIYWDAQEQAAMDVLKKDVQANYYSFISAEKLSEMQHMDGYTASSMKVVYYYLGNNGEKHSNEAIVYIGWDLKEGYVDYPPYDIDAVKEALKGYGRIDL